jgi:hypothetical protein
MTRTRLGRLAVSFVVGALLAGIPSMATARTAPAAAPGVNVCVFYGICAP